MAIYLQNNNIWEKLGSVLGHQMKQNYDSRGAANIISDSANMQNDLNQYNQYQNIDKYLTDWQTARKQYDMAQTDEEKKQASMKGSFARDALYKLGFDPMKYNANTDPSTLTGAYQTTMDQIDALNQKNAGNKSWKPQQNFSSMMGRLYNGV